MKTALITGITGQDGSYLAEFLLEKGYDVHGTIRRSSVDFRERIAHLEGTPHFHLHYADLGDSMSVLGVIGKVRPDEIYNLAAQSHVQVSFDSPEFTADVDAVGVLRILEAVRQLGMTETWVSLRGRLVWEYYDELERTCTERIELSPGGPVVALNVPCGQWHTVKALESGSVILEVKDRPYEPQSPVDILE